MKASVLKFNSLSDLSSFVKTTRPAAYVINTQHLTLTATLTAFELAIAFEQFGSVIASQPTEVAATEESCLKMKKRDRPLQ